MKTNPATLLLGIGLAVLVGGVIVAQKTSASPAPAPTQIPDNMRSWTVADWDAAVSAIPALVNQDINKQLPPHAFITAPNLATTLASLGSDQPWGVNVGTVADWIVQQRAAGHRVYMSQQIVTSTGSGWAFVLDTPPAGWVEVTA